MYQHGSLVSEEQLAFLHNNVLLFHLFITSSQLFLLERFDCFLNLTVRVVRKRSSRKQFNRN